MRKFLQKPKNWQDFELLCKIVWTNVWEAKNVKANGRSGYNQNGVDIFGIPKNESEFFGIQCKGKDDYSNKNLTFSEIDEEINKAKNFKPKLASLIFATTGNKDPKIEEYIRIKNQEHNKSGLFSVEVYMWEDIVDFIEQYKGVREWYNKNITLSSYPDVEVEVNGYKNQQDDPIIIDIPIEVYFVETKLDTSKKKTPRGLIGDLTFVTSSRSYLPSNIIEFSFKINNTGDTSLSNLEFTLKSSNEVVKFAKHENEHFKREKSLEKVKSIKQIRDTSLNVGSDIKFYFDLVFDLNAESMYKINDESVEIEWMFTSKELSTPILGKTYIRLNALAKTLDKKMYYVDKQEKVHLKMFYKYPYRFL